MKKIGIVTEYDNYVGEIVTENNEKYLMLNKDICSDKNNDTYNEIKKGDYVIFEPEIVKTSIEDRNIARFIKKLKNN